MPSSNTTQQERDKMYAPNLLSLPTQTNLTSTKRNLIESPLLRLPAELRHCIFSMLPSYTMAWERDPETFESYVLLRCGNTEILEVCRQIYDEAREYFDIEARAGDASWE